MLVFVDGVHLKNKVVPPQWKKISIYEVPSIIGELSMR
mgnify:CR=1 FL=1